jgi:hypothetical protein
MPGPVDVFTAPRRVGAPYSPADDGHKPDRASWLDTVG